MLDDRIATWKKVADASGRSDTKDFFEKYPYTLGPTKEANKDERETDEKKSDAEEAKDIMKQHDVAVQVSTQGNLILTLLTFVVGPEQVRARITDSPSRFWRKVLDAKMVHGSDCASRVSLNVKISRHSFS